MTQSFGLNAAYVIGYLAWPLMTALLARRIGIASTIFATVLLSYGSTAIINFLVIVAAPNELYLASTSVRVGDTVRPPADHTIDLILFAAIILVPITVIGLRWLARSREVH